MRVQRAPAAADQPQRRPADPVVRPTTAAPGFSAHVDLDLTDLLGRLDDELQVAGEVVVRLVAAFRRERLIDDEVVLQLVCLRDEGMAGAQLGAAVNQSAYGVSSALRAASPTLPVTTARSLTVVHLGGARVHAVGGWGQGGLGIATLGRIAATLVPSEQHGLSVGQRRVARLDVTLPTSSAGAHGVVRALDAVARSVESRPAGL